MTFHQLLTVPRAHVKFTLSYVHCKLSEAGGTWGFFGGQKTPQPESLISERHDIGTGRAGALELETFTLTTSKYSSCTQSPAI